MPRRIGLWVVALLIGGAAPARAQEQTRIEWKFAEGDAFKLEAVLKTKDRTAIQGQESNKTLTLTFQIAFKVLKKQADGSVVLEEKVDKITCDSSADQKLLQAISDQVVGATFKATLTSRMALKTFEGYDAFVRKTAAKDPTLPDAIRQALPEETFKTLTTELFSTFPDRPLGKGDRWENKFQLPMGAVGTVTGTTFYTYQGPAEGGGPEKVTIEAQIKQYTPGRIPGIVPVGANAVKAEGVKGTILFDRKAGRLVTSEMTMQLRGTFRVPSIEPGGDPPILEQSQERTITLKVLPK